MYFLVLFASLLGVLSAQGPARIDELEVNQALGKQLNGNLYFVAGKDTVVRAFLADPAVIDPAQTKLTVTRDGNPAFELAPKAADGPQNIVEFLCPTREACGRWAEGAYVFTATVNGVTRSTDGVKYDFRARQKLRILVRPVKANYKGAIVQVRGDAWKHAQDFLQHTYPIAADGILWDVKEEFDASDAKFDLETDEGSLGLWQALTDLVPKKCAANPKADGCYDLVIGFIPDRSGGYPNGNLQGFTYGRPTNIVVASDQDMPATIPHEIAHIYQAGDTYDGGSLNCMVNPAPDGFKGKDFNDQSKPASCTTGKTALTGVSATLVPEANRPYDVNGGGARKDSACFMGSGGKMADFWISPEVYNRVYELLDPAKVAATKSRVFAAAAPERILFFAGQINAANVFRKEPWYTYQSTEIPKDSTGPLTLRVLDANGAILASQAIEVRFFVNSNPPKQIDWAPFQGGVRFPATAVKLVLAAQETIVWTANVAASDPEISAVFASAAERVEGDQTITWAAKQADNLPLYYLVEYNANVENPGSEWVVLAADLTTPTWKEDFNQFGGGAKARVRVTASDGIRSATVESKTFAVPFKAPELYLNDLPKLTYKPTEALALSCEYDDLQDDAIPDANIVWTSSIAGQIGAGTDILVQRLAPGEHVLTVKVTNSAGLSTSKTVTIKVE